MKLVSILLFLLTLSSLQADIGNADLSKYTHSEASIKKPRYSLGYRASFSTAPSDLELGTFLDNRLTMVSHEDSLYIFISKSASVSYNNVPYFISDGTIVYAESGFSRLQFGVGGFFSFDRSSRYKKSPWESSLEVMLTRYLGNDDNFDFVGMDFKVGLSYETFLSNKWSFSPNMAIGYGILYGTRIDDKNYSLESSISGFVYDIGLTLKYVFQ